MDLKLDRELRQQQWQRDLLRDRWEDECLAQSWIARQIYGPPPKPEQLRRCLEEETRYLAIDEESDNEVREAFES